MKRISMLAAVLLALGISAANAENISATLSGYEEVPVVSTVATGELKGQISPDERFIDYEFSYEGLQASVTQAHIHVAQKSVNGVIVIWLCGTTANPGPTGTPTCTPGSGSFTGTVAASNVVVGTNTQQLASGELAEVIAAMRAGAAYVNVHTSATPTGEIRGQIRASNR